MKKSLIIPLVSLGVVATCTAAIVFNIQKPQITQLKAGTRDAQIVIDSSWVKNVDESYWSFDLIGETQSHYSFKSEECYAGGDTCDFQKTIDDKTYIFVTTGSFNGSSYFALGDMFVENFYSFTSVVISGEFTSSHGTDYQYTFTPSNPGLDGMPDVVTYDPDFVGLDIRSGTLKNNYSSIKLEKITINYTCLS